MEEKNAVNIRLSTFIFILIILLLIVGILYLFFQNNKLQYTNSNNENEVSQLKNTVKKLEQTISDATNTTANISANTSSTNSTVNTSISSSSNIKNTSSCIEIGFEEMIVVLEGKPYVIPIHRPDLNNEEEGLESKGVYYYNKFEVDNIKSGVKKVYAEVLGTDPSTSIYFVMEDGSVNILESTGKIPNIKYTSKEVVSSSNNVVELKMDANILNAITKNGEKIKIAETIN